MLEPRVGSSKELEEEEIAEASKFKFFVDLSIVLALHLLAKNNQTFHLVNFVRVLRHSLSTMCVTSLWN